VAGRERVYLDRIWNDFTGDPSKPDDAPETSMRPLTRSQVVCGLVLHQFSPLFLRTHKDNKIFEQVKLTMLVLAVGGEKSFGPLQAVISATWRPMFREAVVAGSGHVLMEERPAESVALIRNFPTLRDCRVSHLIKFVR